MFARLLGESFARNPRRKVLTAAALMIGMAVATATLTIALEVGDRLAREFRSLGRICWSRRNRILCRWKLVAWIIARWMKART